MAREIDLTKPLSEEDIEYLRARLPEAQVDHMVSLAGAEEAPEPSEDDNEGAEGDQSATGAQEGDESDEDAGSEDDGDEDEDDLLGEDTGDAVNAFDPLTHTTEEVRKYLKSASDDERARVKAVEQERTDREPRSSILNYNPS